VIALAWRNLWRARARSLLTAGVVALVVALGLALLSFTWAAVNGYFATFTARIGHLVVRVENYEKRPLVERVFPAGTRAEVLRVLPGAGVEGRLLWPALVAGERRSEPALLTGLEPGGRLARSLLKGAPLEGGAVLGRALAVRLQKRPGDLVYLYLPEALGEGSGLLPVAATVELLEKNEERAFLALPLATASRLAAPGMVSELVIFLPGVVRFSQQARLELAQRRLSAALPGGLEVLRWDQTVPGLSGMVRVFHRMMLLFVGIFFLLAALILLNTVYLSLSERVREFGLLSALGMTPGRVFLLVYLETLMLTLVGALLGLLLGGAIHLRLARGFALPPEVAESYAEFGLPPVLYGELHRQDVLLVLLFALAAALLAAFWPAFLAARLEPARALRYVAA